ncbi:MAG TPA: peptide deformylase [Anaerohalosphaeraceae bacterium]|nr:peptide deformylase [Anaerohalosphaeraceae bacterium]HOL30937.1 peptide deformylase [Anaerohalosphaeraceae bacterium]HOM76211.1 peptide deformylase [Anaerohalosphaeraceae bacterium]HPC65295.1 peptide deformylase [Anaerohalosphaeraceae bacterium]HPO70487.1 peptide deformylase [Anaerohalosphaeraceae bacterium]
MSDYSKCTITRYPTPVLLEKAQPITDIDDGIRKLAERMIDIMVENKGIGLAGPQAGVNLRIFVISLDGSKENAKVYINPTIKPEGPVVVNEEGCLSLPGLWGKIKRYSRCTVTATDLNGQTFTETGEGLLARALQHEYDHLEGRMIKDRLSQPAKLRARHRLKQLEEEYKNQAK